ncbi:voltage-dependent anion channel [Emericellopsis atlantica]|uniref:Voltage-dependent anion channel n=1 Tax=Emericellopsis atlantica TaxID=2614577 RepID=A0A9P7ZDH9_9HYPO|nr:voltage-dependent anion channel [Emericellopsis atlantica]KAG9250114.1 voltage-dependent anion channel [Emericellopsis atlantica]
MERDKKDKYHPTKAPPKNQRLGLRARLEHFTWANFTCTQSTGAIAILLSETPHQFPGLRTAGLVIFLLNLVLLTLFSLAMLRLHPQTARASFTHLPELFFVGSFWLSIATVIMCIQKYGVPHAGPWLVVVVRVLFWMYAAVSLLFSSALFVVVFLKVAVEPQKISPAAFLMIYCTMLTGTIAATIVETQPPAQRLLVIVAGISYQGLGWTVSLVLMPHVLGSLLRNGVGRVNQRPGLFIPVGSAAFTMVSVVGCANYIPVEYGYFAAHPEAAEVLRVVALWMAIFLWVFTLWLFLLALLVNLPTMFPRIQGRRRLQARMGFSLSWWGIIFPNVGFTIATTYIGQSLESEAILWVATAMTVLLFAVWLLNVCLHVKAIVTGQIMWPGKDEDA